MKTPEELKVLKEEVEALNKKLAELSEEELALVAGGDVPHFAPRNGQTPIPIGERAYQTMNLVID